MRVVALVAGVLGGLGWVARWGADLAGNDPGWGEQAHWAGLALIAVALAVVGAGLVSKGAVWLRAIVAVAFPLLVWSVYAVLRGDGEGVALDGALGLLAVALSIVLLLVGSGAAEGAHSRHGHGAHSAR